MGYSRKRLIATANRAQSAIGGTLETVLSGMAENALGGDAERRLGPEATALGNAPDGAEETAGRSVKLVEETAGSLFKVAEETAVSLYLLAPPSDSYAPLGILEYFLAYSGILEHFLAYSGILEFVKLQVGTQTPAHHFFAKPQTQVIVDLLIVKLAIGGLSLQQIVKPVTLNI